MAVGQGIKKMKMSGREILKLFIFRFGALLQPIYLLASALSLKCVCTKHNIRLHPPAGKLNDLMPEKFENL
jgi:hypothetical protein